METLILVVHVLAALVLVGLILLQHGKGADVGAAFGSGASGSVFGASGSANFLSRTTAVLAIVFFVTSLGLTYFTTQKTEGRGVMATPPGAPAQSLPAQIPPTAPAGQAAPAPADKAAPAAAGEAGSKVGDVPK
ncbi:MAG TPA: preprotein translocase subunit SecG [Burkholderiales bacterium]|nr:preprotein translocase subunit SecG [Burkholderiales bacterium]